MLGNHDDDVVDVDYDDNPTCQVSSVQLASFSGHRNFSRLRRIFASYFQIGFNDNDGDDDDLRRVRVGPINVKVPPWTIGRRQPKVLCHDNHQR